MGSIVANSPQGKKIAAKSEFVVAKAEAAVTEINNDIVILDNAPTNAQVLQVLRRCLVRQRKIINYVASLD